MSNMLEQAIADAAALREQAIKNAEQSVIEKYSHQIKEAVDVMLEGKGLDRVNSVISEVESELNEEMESMPTSFGGTQQGSTIEAPPAWDKRYEDISVRFTALVESMAEVEDGMVEIDLEEFQMSPEEATGGSDDDAELDLSAPSEPSEATPESPEGDAGGDDLGSILNQLQESKHQEEIEEDSEEIQLQEILDMLDEVMIGDNTELDYDPYLPTGHPGPMNPLSKQNMEIANALDEESEEESSSEEDVTAENKQTELYETIEALTTQNDKLVDVLQRLENHLDEALLSNAKLLYQNRTLGDASLNERQKSKIVEAIANAESPKEAKQLHETLKAAVGSTPNSNKGPQSLSESVNRRSNLSAMLNSRQNINESKTADPFLEKMQKLAGIKK